MDKCPTDGRNPSEHAADRSLHRSVTEDDDENVKQLGECSSVYLSLQDCLVRSDRDWKTCQKEVQALRACHENRKTIKR